MVGNGKGRGLVSAFLHHDARIADLRTLSRTGVGETGLVDGDGGRPVTGGTIVIGRARDRRRITQVELRHYKTVDAAELIAIFDTVFSRNLVVVPSLTVGLVATAEFLHRRAYVEAGATKAGTDEGHQGNSRFLGIEQVGVGPVVSTGHNIHHHVLAGLGNRGRRSGTADEGFRGFSGTRVERHRGLIAKVAIQF